MLSQEITSLFNIYEFHLNARNLNLFVFYTNQMPVVQSMCLRKEMSINPT